MATSTGARALGLDATIGSLEPGKQADLIAVRTKTPRMTTLLTGADLNIHHNLVHAVEGCDVDLTMVAGQIVVDGGVLQSANFNEFTDRVNALVPPLFARRSAWLASHGALANEINGMPASNAPTPC